MSSKIGSHDIPPRPSPLQRSTTAEHPQLSNIKRTETSTSLASTASHSQRLHDMLHLHRHHNDKSAENIPTKHKRGQASKDDYTTNSPHTISSPIKAASALLQGLKSKSSVVHGSSHNRSTSAIERIASRTPGLRNSPFASASGSRRGSAVNLEANNDAANTAQLRERPINIDDVLQERQRNSLRMEEVQEAYEAIGDRARNAEGRLEDVYGELQTKIKTLRSTIGELQNLVQDLTVLKGEFKAESGRIEDDFTGKIKAFEGLSLHKGKIEECERRIEEGKNRARKATERLEAARVRVEEWEKREEEWQRKMSSKLGIWSEHLHMLTLLYRARAYRLDIVFSHTHRGRRCDRNT